MANPYPLPSASTQFATGHAPLNGNARQSPISQLCELQRLLLEDARKPSTKPIERAACARAVAAIEQQKRDMRMLPKAKPVEVSQDKRAYRQQPRVADADPSA